MEKIKGRITGIVMTTLSVLLTCGVMFIFPACDAKDDGTWMRCHYAQLAVFAMGCALIVISVIVLICGRSRTGAGASLAAVPLAAAAALTPETVIGLCMMTNMRCHTLMRPAVIVICVLIAAAACVNAFMILRKKDGKSE